MGTEMQVSQDVVPVQRFGFPVEVRNAPLLPFGRTMVLAVPQHELSSAVLVHLLLLTAPWCGAHVRFVRSELELPHEALAVTLGVSGPNTIRNWEAAKTRMAPLSPPVALSLRLLLLERLLPPLCVGTYSQELRTRIANGQPYATAPMLTLDANALLPDVPWVPTHRWNGYRVPALPSVSWTDVREPEVQ